MTVNNYETSVARHEQVAAQQELEKRNRAAWREIISRYGVAGTDANYSIIRDYCGGEITVAKFDWFVKHPPKGISLDWSDEHDKLLDQIVALLRDPYGRRMTEFDLKTWRSRLAVMTTLELRDRLAELTDKQKMALRPVKEIKADLAEFRKQETAMTRTVEGYEKIPSMVVPAWDTKAMPIKEYLDRIARFNIHLFKAAVERWGSKQVDAVRRGF